MKRVGVLIIFLSFCIATSLLANEKRNHFGIFYTPRFDYYPSNEIEVKDWFSYNLESKYSNEAGLQYMRSGKINKHISLVYATYKFATNYNYNFEVDENEIIGHEIYNFSKISLEVGVSKNVFKNKSISLSPMITIGMPTPLVLCTITSYSLNHEEIKREYDFVDFRNNMSSMLAMPNIKLNLTVNYSITDLYSVEVSPFIKKYLNLNNQEKPLTSLLFSGVTVSFLFNSKTRKNDEIN